MNAKTTRTTDQLLAQLAALTDQVGQMQKALKADARASPKGRGKKTVSAVPEYETVEELTLGSKAEPRAYVRSLSDGKRTKVLLSVYSRPIGNPRGSVSDLPQGTVKVSGKYRIPKKAIVVESETEAKALIELLEQLL